MTHTIYNAELDRQVLYTYIHIFYIHMKCVRAAVFSLCSGWCILYSYSLIHGLLALKAN